MTGQGRQRPSTGWAGGCSEAWRNSSRKGDEQGTRATVARQATPVHAEVRLPSRKLLPNRALAESRAGFRRHQHHAKSCIAAALSGRHPDTALPPCRIRRADLTFLTSRGNVGFIGQTITQPFTSKNLTYLNSGSSLRRGFLGILFFAPFPGPSGNSG